MIKSLISLFVLFFIFLINPVGQALAVPPANFQVTQIVGSGLEGPSGFEIAPDGRVFILEREGTIKIYKNGQLLPQPFAVLPTIATGDRGLIGIAFDPEFATNHYVYFYYTGLDTLNRLVRYNAEGDVGTDGPFILYETVEPSNWLHVGGSIRFGPDGKIYFAVGDNGYPPNAQNLGNAHGKILRINKDGSIPDDNPLVNVLGAKPEIWAYGMRNPWRFQFDPLTGKLYGGDVGDFSIEEVNHIEEGKNYGWPICEGSCTTSGMTNPIHEYAHFDDSAAVTGGPVYRGDMFPPSYNGKLFFADYAMGFIKTLNTVSNAVEDFDTAAGAVVDLKVAPDGSMYYITYFPGRLYRISYSEGNHIPVASAGADKTKGVEPLTVNFTSAGSLDPNGDPITFLWDFGDGTTSTEANPIKTYTGKGTYTVQLTVSDATDSAQAVPIVIQVGLPPTLDVVAPADGSNYKAGETIHYRAFASDGAGFDINDAQIVTDIVFHHDTHIHPFINGEQGRVGEFTIPNMNHEPSANTWFEIKVTATDDNGLSTIKSVNIYPLKSTITLKTVINGLQIFLDGVPHTAEYIFEGVAGYVREISTAFIQDINGQIYQFSHWANNGPLTQIFTTPDTDTTVTAYFEAATGFNAQYFDNPDLTGEPVLTRTDQGINFEWNEGSPDPILPNDNFSIRWTGTQHFPAGRYEFSTDTDDGVRLFIDDVLVIDKWFGQSAVNKATVDLTSGDHQIKMEYFENFGGAKSKLSWSKTGDQPEVSGYAAQYFNNKNLEGEPVLTRNETDINFDWLGGSPDPLLPNDEFSARFTKTDNYSQGEYEFKIKTDDGVRFYIDDILVLNRWMPQNTQYTVKKFMAAGDHTLKLEYFENFGDAVVKLEMLKVAGSTPAPTPGSGYLAKFWNTPDQVEPPAIPATEPAVTRNDEAVNFDWGSGTPDPQINLSDFVAVWTKTINFEAKNYKFTAAADDGIRIFIDNVAIVDEWHNSTMESYEVEKLMTAGAHDIRIEYYENEGLASVSFGFEALPTPAGVYSAEYFNNKDLTGTPVLARDEPGIDFDWQGQSPDPLVNVDEFSARWTRLVNFTPGDYKFTITADDGFRLYIDDALVLDRWILQAGETYEIGKTMTAGNHTIKIEYFENFGDAVMKFNYEQTSALPVAFHGEYFDNREASGEPVLVRDDPQINFIWFDQKPDPALPADGFSVRWTKQQQFNAGTYSFTLKSDDGIRFWIDDQLIVDDWNEHALTTHDKTVDIIEGLHTLKIEYFDAYDNAVVKFKQN